MKVVVRSSSLLFTVLSIAFNVPVTRVKRKGGDVPKKPVLRLDSRLESTNGVKKIS